MDETIINGIFFLSFLIIGISSWVLHCKLKKELNKLKKDFDMSKKEAMEFTILTPLFYFQSFNISAIILYFASAGIFLYFFIKVLIFS